MQIKYLNMFLLKISVCVTDTVWRISALATERVQSGFSPE